MLLRAAVIQLTHNECWQLIVAKSMPFIDDRELPRMILSQLSSEIYNEILNTIIS